MSRRAEQIVATARTLIGARFRPQGRSRETGLDCVGLVAASVGADRVRRDYSLRGGSCAELEKGLAAAGLRSTKTAGSGDILVMAAGAGQLHLGICADGGIIHADAGLRRIVERPGPPPWPVIGIWRAMES